MDEHTPEPDPVEPHAVTVSGSDATPDKQVEMVAGATGARIPTGEHRTSGAMPDQSGTQRGRESLLPVLLGLLVLGGLLAWIFSR